MPGLTTDKLACEQAVWKAGHDRLAALSRDGLNIVVPHTGHFILLGQPGVVIA